MVWLVSTDGMIPSYSHMILNLIQSLIIHDHMIVGPANVLNMCMIRIIARIVNPGDDGGVVDGLSQPLLNDVRHQPLQHPWSALDQGGAVILFHLDAVSGRLNPVDLYWLVHHKGVEGEDGIQFYN